MKKERDSKADQAMELLGATLSARRKCAASRVQSAAPSETFDPSGFFELSARQQQILRELGFDPEKEVARVEAGGGGSDPSNDIAGARAKALRQLAQIVIGARR